MTTFRSKMGEWKVMHTYMDHVRLKRGGTLSLYWVSCKGNFSALLVQRKAKGKVIGEFLGVDYREAVKVFTQRILREGLRSGPRKVHELALRIRPKKKSGFRCMAFCKTDRKMVDVSHAQRIGAIALAFKGLNKLCSCRHRKQYEIVDDISVYNQTRVL